VDRLKLLHSLDLDDDGAADEQINPVPASSFNALYSTGNAT
jgi:hypothetical protein